MMMIHFVFRGCMLRGVYSGVLINILYVYISCEHHILYEAQRLIYLQYILRTVNATE